MLDSNRILPDVSTAMKTAMVATLDKVGMAGIEMPVYVQSGGERFRIPARVDAFVSLDEPHAKGIHMSRLYRELRDAFAEGNFGWELVATTLKKFLNTHKELSKRSYLKVALELPIERSALKSGEKGWRQYPVVLKGRLEDGKFDFSAEITILYSSTCPCSAALARQLVAHQFRKDLGGKAQLTSAEVYDWLEKDTSIVAVPHSQRSEAQVKFKFGDTDQLLQPEDMIELLENALGTPVQTAVKREDEQEFARLNGTQLMFCEDAARKLKNTLDARAEVIDYWVRVAHHESLHPHDAVSVVVKGVAGGYGADE